MLTVTVGPEAPGVGVGFEGDEGDDEELLPPHPQRMAATAAATAAPVNNRDRMLVYLLKVEILQVVSKRDTTDKSFVFKYL
jgi:hypothetical protein